MACLALAPQASTTFFTKLAAFLARFAGLTKRPKGLSEGRLESYGPCNVILSEALVRGGNAVLADVGCSSAEPFYVQGSRRLRPCSCMPPKAPGNDPGAKHAQSSLTSKAAPYQAWLTQTIRSKITFNHRALASICWKSSINREVRSNCRSAFRNITQCFLSATRPQPSHIESHSSKVSLHSERSSARWVIQRGRPISAASLDASGAALRTLASNKAVGFLMACSH